MRTAVDACETYKMGLKATRGPQALTSSHSVRARQRPPVPHLADRPVPPAAAAHTPTQTSSYTNFTPNLYSTSPPPRASVPHACPPLTRPQMAGSIIVYNASSSPCHVFVSKYTNSSGSDDWYTLQPGQRDSWARSGWELVAFKNGDDSVRNGVYVARDTTVTYNGITSITTN